MKEKIQKSLARKFNISGRTLEEATERVLEMLPQHLQDYHADIFSAVHNLGEAEKILLIPAGLKSDWEPVEEVSLLKKGEKWFYSHGGHVSDMTTDPREFLHRHAVQPHSEESSQNALAALRKYFPDSAAAAQKEREELIERVNAYRREQEQRRSKRDPSPRKPRRGR